PRQAQRGPCDPRSRTLGCARRAGTLRRGARVQSPGPAVPDCPELPAASLLPPGGPGPLASHVSPLHQPAAPALAQPSKANALVPARSVADDRALHSSDGVHAVANRLWKLSRPEPQLHSVVRHDAAGLESEADRLPAFSL